MIEKRTEILAGAFRIEAARAEGFEVRLFEPANAEARVVLVRKGVAEVRLISGIRALAVNQFRYYVDQLRQWEEARAYCAMMQSFRCHVCGTTIDWPGCCSAECYNAWKGDYMTPPMDEGRMYS